MAAASDSPPPGSPPKWRQFDDFKVDVLKRLEVIEERLAMDTLRREAAEQRALKIGDADRTGSIID